MSQGGRLKELNSGTVQSVVTDSGTATPTASGVLNLLGLNGITTNASGDTANVVGINATAAASAGAAQIGVAAFNSSDFSVVDGFVSLSGGGGSISIGAFGSTPNANGLTLLGSVLNMEPADALHPGGISIGAQSFGGPKIFTANVTLQGSSNAVGTITSGVWNGTIIGVAYGGTGTSTAFTQGSVVFAGSSGIYSQDNANLFYDSTNKFLGLGTATPAANLHIARSSAATTGASPYFSLVSAADTGITASSAGVRMVNLDFNNTRTLLAGAVASASVISIARPTIQTDSASTYTLSANVDIEGPLRSGNNLTSDKSASLRIRGPNSVTGTGVCTASYGIHCAAPFGATNNYSGIFYAGNFGIGTETPTAVLQITRSATGANPAHPFLQVTLANETTLTASTEIPIVVVDSGTRTWSTGALTTQRNTLFNQNTMAFSGSSTLTDAATVGIAGAPIKGSNATLTNTHGLLISAGAVSTATNSYGLTCNAQTGATNNYSAQFLGGITTGVNFSNGFTTTATAAGTTTLTINSNKIQYFTGSTTQTVTLPVASTLPVGIMYIIGNQSSGNVTVQSSGGNTLAVLTNLQVMNVICTLASGTGTASWSWWVSTLGG